MKKHTLKAVTMLASIVALAFMTALVTSAQTGGHKMRANIPFDFVVGDRTLAAGQYSVERTEGLSQGITVRSLDSRERAIRLTSSVKAAPKRRGVLTFRRYGDTYYLAQIWTPGSSEGREMIKSKAERNAEKGAAQLARNGGEKVAEPETVTIFAELQ